MSKFRFDLSKEQVLAQYLDDVYSELKWSVKRVSDSANQNKGIDVIIDFNTRQYHIDEKAQLHYLNSSLPTFAFEVSYLKKNILKQGWLFDQKKVTDYYFLVTDIMLKKDSESLTTKSDIKSLKVTSVNRGKLLKLLENMGLDKSILDYNAYNIRETKAFGKHVVNGMDSRSEGYIHFTESLSEQPINLVLKLSYLLKMGVAKTIYPKV